MLAPIPAARTHLCAPQPGCAAAEESSSRVIAMLDALCKQVHQDGLDIAHNQRTLLQRLALELAHTQATGDVSLLLLIQVEPAMPLHSQTVYEQTAACLHAHLSTCDALVRCSPNLFALVLPGRAGASGQVLAQRLHQHLQAQLDPSTLSASSIYLAGAYAVDWLHNTPSLWLERARAQLERALATEQICIDGTPHCDTSVSAQEKHLLFISLASADNNLFANWWDGLNGQFQPMNGVCCAHITR
jgi:GGDEF domain-containing protein